MKWGSKSANTPTEVANLFNEFFASVFTAPSDLCDIESSADANIHLNDVSFSITDIENLLSKEKESSLACTDNVPPFVLSNCSSILAPVVYSLFTLLISHCHWPTVWKSAVVTPVFKSGDRCSVTNYRPISILPRLSLIFERCIHNYIFEKIRPHIAKYQHGFMNRRSTTTQLLHFSNLVFNSRDTNSDIDCIYFDFRKAFDSVNHRLLLQKLAYMGFDAPFLNLLKSYLHQRVQSVRIGDVISISCLVTSGVPQGSVLGPLLFLIYINDLPMCICHSSLFLFADDSKLLGTPDMLQIDIDNFIGWSERNFLSINHSKVQRLNFSRTVHPLYLNDRLISPCDNVVDLGIIFSGSLSWSGHIDRKLHKCMALLHSFRRAVPWNCPIHVKLTIYHSCILSVLCYNSQIWYPSISDMRRLERFNKHCLFWIYGKSDYHQILNDNNLLPLCYQLLYADLVFFAKILHGGTDICISDFVVLRQTRDRRQRLIELPKTKKFSLQTGNFSFERAEQ